MSPRDVKYLLLDKPQVGLRILEVLARKLKEAETRWEELTFKSIPARLASLLLKLATNNSDQMMVQGYTHLDFAEMIGTYRETTTLKLNYFKSQGWIDIKRKHIQVLDPTALEELSEFT